MNSVVLVTKNSRWRWAKSVTCFTKLDDHTELIFFFVFMLSDILKIADDLRDWKDALLTNDITVSVTSKYFYHISRYCCCEQELVNS